MIFNIKIEKVTLSNEQLHNPGCKWLTIEREAAAAIKQA